MDDRALAFWTQTLDVRSPLRARSRDAALVAEGSTSSLGSAYAQMGHLCLGHLIDTLFTPSDKPFKSGLLLCQRGRFCGRLLKLYLLAQSRALGHSKLFT